MNEDTLVAVCCYAGDGHQVINALGQFLHHGCPVVVFSPTDSPADIRYPGVEHQLVGKVGYIHQVSLDRQRLHLEKLLTYPQNHFLLHDADSVCLDPEIPRYLYAEPDVVWSNLVVDDVHQHQRPANFAWPHLAFQPPYFLSRKTIQAMLAIADQVIADPITPFIDFYMVQLAVLARLPYRGFPNGASCETVTPLGERLMSELVRNQGKCLVHAIKRKVVLDHLMSQYAKWREKM